MTLEDRIITITDAKRCACGAPIFGDFYEGEYQTQCRTCSHKYFKDEYEELEDYGSLEIIKVNPRRIILEKYPELSQYDYVYCWGNVPRPDFFKVSKDLFCEIKNAISPVHRFVESEIAANGINNLYIGEAFSVAIQGLQGLSEESDLNATAKE